MYNIGTVKSKSLTVGLVCVVFTVFSRPLSAQKQLQTPQESVSFVGVADSAGVSFSLLDVNNFELWIANDGRVGIALGNLGKGDSYPIGTSNVLFSDGIVWGGNVHDGLNPPLRIGGQHYRSATNPGSINAQPDSTKRIYRIRKDCQTADLRWDASRFLQKAPGLVTDDEIRQLRARYEKDWKEWPVALGAPFEDRNGNGVYDSSDVPGLFGANQVIWLVVNDLQPDTSVFHSPLPIGIEMQLTLWAYDNSTTPYPMPSLKDIVFKRVKLIYKGLPNRSQGPYIDSMFIAQWSDPDIGSESDDYLGCDTVRQIAFAYNASPSDRSFGLFGINPPSFGYVLLQGPLVAGSANDKGISNFKERSGFKNLKMSSFWPRIVGLGMLNFSPFDVAGWWKALRGFVTFDGPDVYYYHPPGYPVTRFPYSGDPVSGTGYTANNPNLPYFLPVGGDAKFMINMGPLTMALGDTQEVVIAMIGGAGSNYLNNITIMKNRADMVAYNYPALLNEIITGVGTENKPENIPDRYSLSQNFPNPFNPFTRVDFTIPVDANVQLAIYDLLGREIGVLHEGYKPGGSYFVMWDGRDRTIKFCQVECTSIGSLPGRSSNQRRCSSCDKDICPPRWCPWSLSLLTKENKNYEARLFLFMHIFVHDISHVTITRHKTLSVKSLGGEELPPLYNLCRSDGAI